MYFLKTEESFDAAHFLKGYNGKCKNMHGHRWRVEVEICGEELNKEGQYRGMLVDFSILKRDLKNAVDLLDHKILIEKDVLDLKMLSFLEEEKYEYVKLDDIPTAEHLAKYFYDQLKNKDYNMHFVRIYETPNNCITYAE